MSRVCIVSAFLDIGRENWNTFSRSIDRYFNNFLPYTKFNFGDNEMIVFIDDRYYDKLSDLCLQNKQIKIIAINREFMSNNIYAYQQLSREREIMQSENFQRIIKHRIHHPECSKPEYNIMQHAKIDFVCYVINNKLSEADFFAWSDFGYFQNPQNIPAKFLDISKFDTQKINFSCINPITEQDASIPYTLVHAPEKIGGFFYFGSKELMLRYQELYHEIYSIFHKLGIVDDDQHFMIQSYFRKPDLFHLWNMGGWHLTYLKFAKD